MRTKSIYIFQLVFQILLFLFFSSCKEDIVSSSSGTYIGPPRFHWKIDTLVPTTCDMLILDTNNYFTISNYIYFGEVHHFKNGISTEYNIGHLATSMDGTDENNIFIGGSKNIHDNFSSPSLTKFTNGIFTEINTGCDTAEYNCATSIKIINNNVWGVTSRGEAFKYDGVNTTYYRVDTNYYSEMIASDIYNNVYIFMVQLIYDSLGIPINDKHKVLSFQNNEWRIIYEYLNTANHFEYFYRFSNNRIFSKQIAGTYDFHLGNFSLVFDEKLYGIDGKFGGNYLNNYIIICPSYTDYMQVYHWNGFILSNETSNITNRRLLELCNIIKTTEIHNKFFVLFWDYGLTDRSYFLKTIY